MPTQQYPIVGMYYRKPADKLVRVLPVNAKLTLVAEPFNEFDPNAIAVWLELADLSKNAKVMQVLASHEGGHLVTAEHIQLGYLPKEVAQHLRRTGFPRTGEIQATFNIPFGSNVPHARFDDDAYRTNE